MFNFCNSKLFLPLQKVTSECNVQINGNQYEIQSFAAIPSAYQISLKFVNPTPNTFKTRTTLLVQGYLTAIANCPRCKSDIIVNRLTITGLNKNMKA